MSKSFTISGSDSYCTYVATVTSAIDSLKISGSTYNIQSLLPTALTGTITGNTWQGAYIESNIFYGSGDYTYIQIPIAAWPSGTSKSSTPYQTRAYSCNTSSIFNSSNPNDREVTVYYNTDGTSGMFRGGTSAQLVGWQNKSSFTLGQKLILDVPPTFTASSISYDTPYVYSGLTTASVTVSDASAKYGGNITSVAFTIGNQTVTRSNDGTLSILLDTGGVFTPTVTVTDSRGQTTTKSLDPITVNIYTAPSISFDVARTLNDGTPDDEGTYGLIEAELTFSDAVATAVAPSVVLTDDEGTQTTPTTTWYTSSSLATQVTWANVSSGDTVYGLFSGLSTQHSYQVSVRPRDSEGTGTAVTQTIAPAFYTIDFYAGGHGIAFGKPASNVGFECAMGASFIDANGTMRALFDFIYPVGSYYETSDISFNPNITWGGTWSLEAEGLVHIGAGSNYTVGDTGGEEKHTLTINEMPSHSHTFGLKSNVTVPQGSYYGVKIYDASSSTSNTGGDQAHNNMQPYIVVNRWHRTA